MSSGLVEHLFRHQSGRMVSHLARLLGTQHLDLAEEAAQDALLKALAVWPMEGVPPNPEAWLYRVAHNSAIDALRRRRWLNQNLIDVLHQSVERPPVAFGDDELAMIFMCCHPEIPHEARVALSLKTVGGFNVREIARAFLAEDAAISQRLVRAKAKIRERRLALELPEGEELDERLDSVLEVVYFIFNEGYTACEGDDLVRTDLCEEALRLCRLIAASALVQPKVHALIALMALHAARLPARSDVSGDLILLEHQDRSLWDQRLIAMGLHYFGLCLSGKQVTRYHTESALAVAHAKQDPNWQHILTLYDDLLEFAPDSPVALLNRSVAVSKVRGSSSGLAELDRLEPTLKNYYLYLAVRGHFLEDCGRYNEAAEQFRAALACRCTEPERRFLRKKLEAALRERI